MGNERSDERSDVAELAAELAELGVRLKPGMSDEPSADVAQVVYDLGWRKVER